VDEQFGATILRDAAVEGIVTACPAEKSGQAEFEFEYGEDFARHIEAFAPTFCKVLVRYNTEGERALNQRQAARLKRLSDYLAANQRSRFMFELLVPAEKAQLDRFKGDRAAYDLELRPRLMEAAIGELQEAGVEPDLWKVEGLDRREDASESWRRRGRAAVTMSAASFSAVVRTTGRCGNGSGPRPRYLVSSALRSAAPISGNRWSPGGRGRRRGSRPSPRSRGAIVNSSISSKAGGHPSTDLWGIGPDHNGRSAKES